MWVASPEGAAPWHCQRRDTGLDGPPGQLDLLAFQHQGRVYNRVLGDGRTLFCWVLHTPQPELGTPSHRVPHEISTPHRARRAQTPRPRASPHHAETPSERRALPEELTDDSPHCTGRETEARQDEATFLRAHGKSVSQPERAEQTPPRPGTARRHPQNTRVTPGSKITGQPYH